MSLELLLGSIKTLLLSYLYWQRVPEARGSNSKRTVTMSWQGSYS